LHGEEILNATVAAVFTQSSSIATINYCAIQCRYLQKYKSYFKIKKGNSFFSVSLSFENAWLNNSQ